MDVIACEGPSNLRQKLVYATLSGKVLRVNKIREKDERPGLQPHEASLLRLMEKITNGSLVEISETGTSLRYKPGIICGGANLRHDCGKARAIGYFLEPLVLLSLFGKKPLTITLTGITNDDIDLGGERFAHDWLAAFRGEKAAGSETLLNVESPNRQK